MIGTQTVNSIAETTYYFLICTILLALSIYDIKTQRVPNWTLAAFSIIILPGPLLMSSGQIAAIVQSLMGAISGFGILLIAALLSSEGAGVGGGDIKLAGLLGYAFGIGGIAVILIAAALTAAPVALLCKRLKKSPQLHIPFVPFITLGAVLVVVSKI